MIILFILLLPFSTYAQYPPTSPVPSDIKSDAHRLANRYSDQLALTGIQIPLFKNVLEEYMMKAEKAISIFEGREELNMLVELQARESLEMNDILTQIQYRLYQRLKFEYQPLKVISDQEYD